MWSDVKSVDYFSFETYNSEDVDVKFSSILDALLIN